jgi:hypothetical protein
MMKMYLSMVMREVTSTTSKLKFSYRIGVLIGAANEGQYSGTQELASYWPSARKKKLS